MTTQNANPEDEVLCHCSGTTRGEIHRLLEQGLKLDGISRMTGAVSGCGGCEWDVIQLLQDFAAQQNTADKAAVKPLKQKSPTKAGLGC